MKVIAFITASLISVTTFAANIEGGGSDEFDLNANKQQSISLSFDNSPRMGELLKSQLAQNGFKIVEDNSEADINVKIMGIFTFQKPHAKKMVVDLGKVIESDDGKLLSSKNEEAFRVPSLNMSYMQPNVTLGVALGVGMVDSVLQLAGVRSWFNKLVAGDERGFCLGTAEQCKDFKKYIQEVRVAAIVSPKTGGEKIVRAFAKTKDEQLFPSELFQASLIELSSRLTGTTGEKVTASEAVTAGDGNVQ